MVRPTKGHWRAVYGRIWNEIRQDLRLDTPVRLVRELLAFMLAWAVAYVTTRGVGWTVAVPLLVICVLAPSVLLWKLVTLPPRMAAEHEADILALQAVHEDEIRRQAAEYEAEIAALKSRLDNEEKRRGADQEAAIAALRAILENEQKRRTFQRRRGRDRP